MPIPRADIEAANACPAWRKFKAELTTMSVDSRMRILLDYVKPQDWQQNREARRTRNALFRNEEAIILKIVEAKQCCDHQRRCVQAMTYINSMARAGSIEPLHRSWQYIDQVQKFLEGGHWKVRR